MSGEIKSAVSAATLRLLRPLAHFLLEARIGIGEFNALARLAYVQAAIATESGGRRYRVNVSRIAALTGLTRVDVAALLSEHSGALPRTARGAVRAERVLNGWWNDPQFHNRAGTPERLKLKGTRGSFAALVKRYSGDGENTAPILDELLRSKAVREHPDGTLEVLSRTCITVGWDQAGISTLGEELAEHFETVLYNLKNPDHPRLARRVVSRYLDAQAARVLIPELTEQAEIFLDGAQEALNHPKYSSSKRTGPNGLKFAIAVQFFQEPSAAEPDPPRVRRRAGPMRPTRRKSRQAQRRMGAL